MSRPFVFCHMMASPDGEPPALFETAGRTPDAPRGFRLEAAGPKNGDSVWLRYTVDNTPSN